MLSTRLLLSYQINDSGTFIDLSVRRIMAQRKCRPQMTPNASPKGLYGTWLTKTSFRATENKITTRRFFATMACRKTIRFLPPIRRDNTACVHASSAGRTFELYRTKTFCTTWLLYSVLRVIHRDMYNERINISLVAQRWRDPTRDVCVRMH